MDLDQMTEGLQTDFFADIGEDLPHGTVEPLSDGRWIAKIGGGWWVATGGSKAQAIKSVLKKYYDEVQKYEFLG